MNVNPAQLAEEHAALQALMVALAAEENASRITAPLHGIDAAARKLASLAPKTPEGQMAQVFIEQAAQLSDADYEAGRKTLAQNAGVRVSVLDAERSKRRPHEAKQGEPLTFIPTEPWPEAVNAADLIKDIAVLVRRHVILSPDDAVTVTLWIVATYFSEVIDYAPILGVTSATKRCGKTTLLGLLARLVFRPMSSSNISGPMIFRVITQCKPTLLIDEADTFLPENEALRGVINSGQSREVAFTIRGVGEDFEPRRFSTWGLKAIACIGKLPATVADRALPVRMERKAKSEHIEKLRATAPEKFETLRRKLTRFSADNFETIKASRPAIPDELNDREADTWGPLLAIADLAGQKWGERARLAAKHLKASDPDADDFAVELLQDCYRAMGGDDRIFSESLIERLCLDSTRPWATFNKGKPISARQVAARLKLFGIFSGSMRLDTGNRKGYACSDFLPAIARYPLPSVTTSQPNNGAVCDDFLMRHTSEIVTDKKSLKPSNGAACDGVTDKTPLEGEL